MQATTDRANILIRKRSSGFAFVVLDGPSKTNTLTSALMQEVAQTLDRVSADASIKALGIISGKSDIFCSGADIKEIRQCGEADIAYQLSRRAQELFDKVAKLGKPVVVGINGPCLGAGLELALTCTKRIATDGADTLLGLPETKLGFIPGAGGTQRLPRLIGVRHALELILTGEPISAAKALEIKLVDKVVCADSLLSEVESAALALLESRCNRADNTRHSEELPPEKLKSLFAMMERSVRIKTKGHYPAQTKAIEVIKLGLEQGIVAGLEAEAKAFGDLAVSDVSHNLVSLFYNTELAKGQARSLVLKAGSPKVSVLGIVGGGLMGRTIACLAAQHGFRVLFKSAHPQRQEKTLQDIKDMLHSASSGGSFEIQAVDHFQSLGDADIVIEACTEDEAVKSAIFAELSAKTSPACVIVSNTSSLSITGLAKHVQHSERFLGLHFFHPVDRMPLVEIIPHSGTNKESIARATALLSALGKIPAPVKDSACFLLNRLLYCYLREAATAAAEAVPLNWIEDAAIDFGMPMGPLALLDEIGLDVSIMVANALVSAFGPRLAPPAELERAVKLGWFGKKTGSGLYDWEQNSKKIGFSKNMGEAFRFVVTDSKPEPETMKKLARRMVLPMVDEAARCLEEQVVRRAREIDLCTILGMGFPPFRGGLLRYADSLAVGNVVETLNDIYAETGGQRTVSTFLNKLLAQRRGFHSASAD